MSLAVAGSTVAGRHRRKRKRSAARVAAAAALVAAPLSAAVTGLGVAPAAATTSHAPLAAQQWPWLTIGSTGSAVRYVQLRVHVTPSGIYGPITARAVKDWETRHHVPSPNGVVGPVTWKAMHVPYHRVSSADLKRAAILRVARSLFGKPYAAQGYGPNSFNCSGYTRWVYYHAIHKLLSKSPTGQMQQTRRISRSQAKPGDLMFVPSGSGARHAAIYAGGSYWYEAADYTRPIGKAKIWTSNVVYGTVF